MSASHKAACCCCWGVGDVAFCPPLKSWSTDNPTLWQCHNCRNCKKYYCTTPRYKNKQTILDPWVLNEISINFRLSVIQRVIKWMWEWFLTLSCHMLKFLEAFPQLVWIILHNLTPFKANHQAVLGSVLKPKCANNTSQCWLYISHLWLCISDFLLFSD